MQQRISESHTFRKGDDINFQSLFPIIGKPFDDLYCTIKVKTTFCAHGGCKLSCTPGSYSEFLRFINSTLCLVRMRSHGSARSVFTLDKLCNIRGSIVCRMSMARKGLGLVWFSEQTYAGTVVAWTGKIYMNRNKLLPFPFSSPLVCNICLLQTQYV